ncbi:MAG: adenylate/guanylate cyclase domain-containing protein, partial [Cyanobacteria bacterium NC_groundwater_1444_Ag_S-0.65um_54_12]|nr:adenylate/guanylate cyclase domain-containing protein [Cyanobacteria bacterium NC_groundwater_1444_Ag_S-0.65um_54_12]
MNCPSCQAALPFKANFCGYCGARLASNASDTNSSVILPIPVKLSTTGDSSPPASSHPATNNVAAGDRRVVTVLFADVSGFTAMSERLDPEEVREVVNSFFRVVTEPIYRYGGIVDKYIGDAVMAIFGAPLAHEDDAERAMMAAWSMQGITSAFATKTKARTGTQLQLRVGLNTGLVVAGTVGGAYKQDYTVIGDTVNLAQRMEASAKPGQVLITQETFKLTHLRFEYGEGVPIKVKGRQEPVTSYVLRGPRDGSSAFRDRLPLVGRKNELKQLKTVLEHAIHHSPQSVNLVGETGMG